MTHCINCDHDLECHGKYEDRDKYAQCFRVIGDSICPCRRYVEDMRPESARQFNTPSPFTPIGGGFTIEAGITEAAQDEMKKAMMDLARRLNEGKYTD